MTKENRVLSSNGDTHSARQWEKDCKREHGRVLVGGHKHYCYDWDGLPIDETCKEWESCLCFVAKKGER